MAFFELNGGNFAVGAHFGSHGGHFFIGGGTGFGGYGYGGYRERGGAIRVGGRDEVVGRNTAQDDMMHGRDIATGAPMYRSGFNGYPPQGYDSGMETDPVTSEMRLRQQHVTQPDAQSQQDARNAQNQAQQDANGQTQAPAATGPLNDLPADVNHLPPPNPVGPTIDMGSDEFNKLSAGAKAVRLINAPKVVDEKGAELPPSERLRLAHDNWETSLKALPQGRDMSKQVGGDFANAMLCSQAELKNKTITRDDIRNLDSNYEDLAGQVADKGTDEQKMVVRQRQNKFAAAAKGALHGQDDAIDKALAGPNGNEGSIDMKTAVPSMMNWLKTTVSNLSNTVANSVQPGAGQSTTPNGQTPGHDAQAAQPGQPGGAHTSDHPHQAGHTAQPHAAHPVKHINPHLQATLEGLGFDTGVVNHKAYADSKGKAEDKQFDGVEGSRTQQAEDKITKQFHLKDHQEFVGFISDAHNEKALEAFGQAHGAFTPPPPQVPDVRSNKGNSQTR